MKISKIFETSFYGQYMSVAAITVPMNRECGEIFCLDCIKNESVPLLVDVNNTPIYSIVPDATKPIFMYIEQSRVEQ